MASAKLDSRTVKLYYKFYTTYSVSKHYLFGKIRSLKSNSQIYMNPHKFVWKLFKLYEKNIISHEVTLMTAISYCFAIFNILWPKKPAYSWQRATSILERPPSPILPTPLWLPTLFIALFFWLNAWLHHVCVSFYLTLRIK